MDSPFEATLGAVQNPVPIDFLGDGELEVAMDSGLASNAVLRVISKVPSLSNLFSLPANSTAGACSSPQLFVS